MKTSEVLRNALALLGPNGEHWIKDTSRKDCNGKELSGTEGKAVYFCASAAIISSETLDRRDFRVSPAWEALSKVIRKHIPSWNDAPKRTFAEVKAAFNKAIAKAAKAEAQ